MARFASGLADTLRPQEEALCNDRSGPRRYPDAQSNAASLPHSRIQSAAACCAMTNVSRRPWRTTRLATPSTRSRNRRRLHPVPGGPLHHAAPGVQHLVGQQVQQE